MSKNSTQTQSVNLNEVVSQLPEYFLADDIRAMYPNKPDGSITRWISTLVKRGSIARLRSATRANENEHAYKAMYQRLV